MAVRRRRPPPGAAPLGATGEVGGLEPRASGSGRERQPRRSLPRYTRSPLSPRRLRAPDQTANATRRAPVRGDAEGSRSGRRRDRGAVPAEPGRAARNFLVPMHASGARHGSRFGTRSRSSGPRHPTQQRLTRRNDRRLPRPPRHRRAAGLQPLARRCRPTPDRQGNRTLPQRHARTAPARAPGDAIRSSPYARACQTAELLHEEAGWPPAQHDPTLAPNQSPAEALPLLQTLTEPASVALVGHEPYLSSLASLLVSGNERALRLELKKGAVVRLAFVAAPCPRRSAPALER